MNLAHTAYGRPTSAECTIDVRRPGSVCASSSAASFAALRLFPSVSSVSGIRVSTALSAGRLLGTISYCATYSSLNIALVAGARLSLDSVRHAETFKGFDLGDL